LQTISFNMLNKKINHYTTHYDKKNIYYNLDNVTAIYTIFVVYINMIFFICMNMIFTESLWVLTPPVFLLKVNFISYFFKLGIFAKADKVNQMLSIFKKLIYRDIERDWEYILL